jgi:hypothetical protein
LERARYITIESEYEIIEIYEIRSATNATRKLARISINMQHSKDTIKKSLA